MDKFSQENGLLAGLEPSGDPPSALPPEAKIIPPVAPISIVALFQWILEEIFIDLVGRRRKEMSELTQVGLDGDTSDTLRWQPATKEERAHVEAIWKEKAASVKIVDPDSSPGAAALKLFRKFWSRW